MISCLYLTLDNNILYIYILFTQIFDTYLESILLIIVQDKVRKVNYSAQGKILVLRNFALHLVGCFPPFFPPVFPNFCHLPNSTHYLTVHPYYITASKCGDSAESHTWRKALSTLFCVHELLS